MTSYRYPSCCIDGDKCVQRNTKIIGNINLAYLFALSEFVMAWILAAVYIRRANRVFDPLAAAVRRLAARMGFGS